MRGFSKRSGEVHRVSQCEKIYTPQGINEHTGRFTVANIVTIFLELWTSLTNYEHIATGNIQCADFIQPFFWLIPESPVPDYILSHL